MKAKHRPKPFWEMTTADLRAATKEFDAPSGTSYGFRPLTPKQQAEWKRIKRRPGRPRVGKGAKSVLISIEKELLKSADAFAKKSGLSRSQLIARLLKDLPKAG